MSDGTLDKLMDKAGRVAESAVKTTTNLVNKGKDKAEEMALQSKLMKVHRQLGSLVYALRKNNEENEPMIAWYISEIDRINARITLLQTNTTPPAQDNVYTYTPPNTDWEDDGDAMFRGGGDDEFP